MSDLQPNYGNTRLDVEELDLLTSQAVQLLGENPTRAAVYDLEQQTQIDVAADLLTTTLRGGGDLEALLQWQFVRDAHYRMFGEVWNWAGKSRRVITNIGVEPQQIGEQMHQFLGNALYRWANTDWDARDLGLTVHAELTRIHPFQDGNGRVSRLWADLVYVAAQAPGAPRLYDWNVDRRSYIEALRDYDAKRDVAALLALVGDEPIDPE